MNLNPITVFMWLKKTRERERERANERSSSGMTSGSGLMIN